MVPLHVTAMVSPVLFTIKVKSNVKFFSASIVLIDTTGVFDNVMSSSGSVVTPPLLHFACTHACARAQSLSYISKLLAPYDWQN